MAEVSMRSRAIDDASVIAIRRKDLYGRSVQVVAMHDENNRCLAKLADVLGD
jgi:hypothetical protein